MHAEILKPVAALIVWSLVVLVWLLAVRLPAMQAAGVQLGALRGGTGKDADGVLPARAQWPAHNYNHLMEQPTLFYAVALVLAVTGADAGWPVLAAWAYVLLRIAHSLVQVLSGRVLHRFVLFGLSTLALIALALRAALAVF